ncbi:hypothetical protein SDJN03_26811, partial [Cucurbita argyrosperma subsp. sororia]
MQKPFLTQIPHHSSPHSPKNSPSGSLIKEIIAKLCFLFQVDAPVRSVPNLFTSSAKKLKCSLSNENTKR